MFLNRCSKDYLKFCLTKMIQIGVCQESGPVVFSFTTSSTLHGLPRAVVFTRAWVRFISNKHMALRSCFSVSFLCADFPSPPRAYWPNRALLTEAWAERDNGKRFECSVFIRSISDVTFDCALRTTVNRVPHRKAGLAERLENEPTEDEAMIVVSLVSQQYCYEHVVTQPWTVKQLKIFNRQKRAIFTVKEKPFFFLMNRQTFSRSLKYRYFSCSSRTYDSQRIVLTGTTVSMFPNILTLWSYDLICVQIDYVPSGSTPSFKISMIYYIETCFRTYHSRPLSNIHMINPEFAEYIDWTTILTTQVENLHAVSHF